jgi:hypothetical protein
MWAVKKSTKRNAARSPAPAIITRHGQPGRDFKTWEEEKPPVGTLYNYPPRGDVIALLPGYPTPARIGTQINILRKPPHRPAPRCCSGYGQGVLINAPRYWTRGRRSALAARLVGRDPNEPFLVDGVFRTGYESSGRSSSGCPRSPLAT